ncbi:hypothetical protein N7490_006634 [Penicillium lividum]|nr:hypothetical protein N7490_006634 [Penicillium lividum]
MFPVTPDFGRGSEAAFHGRKSIHYGQLKRTSIETKEFGLPPIRLSEQNAALLRSIAGNVTVKSYYGPLLDREMDRNISNQ